MEGQRDGRGATEVVARQKGRSETEVEAQREGISATGWKGVTDDALVVTGGGAILAARMDSDGEAPAFWYAIMVTGGGMINKI